MLQNTPTEPMQRPVGLDFAAAASAAAALIHAAASGSHGDQSSVQLLFAVCAGLQLAWAATALMTTRRLVVAAGLVLNAGAALAWLVQRTVGLPLIDALSEPESVGFQDSLAALLGTLAAVGAGASLLPSLSRHAVPRGWAAAGGAFALVLALPAMAVDHESGSGHSHGGEEEAAADGDHEHAAGAEGDEHAAGEDHEGDGHENMVEVADEDRCDLGFNTAEFNDTTMLVDDMEGHDHAGGVDFTVADWSEVFADESIGIEAEPLAEWISADEYRARDVLGGDLTPYLEPDPWVPMTDPAECAALASELQQARDAAARYPTLADAMADGYEKGSAYAPGQGAHYSCFEYIADGVFNPAQPDLLMYDGDEPDSRLMGMMYYLPDWDGLPEEVGFTGDSDMWHSHQSLCRDAEGAAVSWRECDEGRGTVTDESYGYMLHAWVVPGCESAWGIFSPANPALPYLPDASSILADPGQVPFSADVTMASGCNSGKTVTDRPELDGSGSGTTIQ